MRSDTVPSTYTLRRRKSNDRLRLGVTAFEALVAVAVVGVLLALTIPAVLQARETSRNFQCKNLLRQYGLAILGYSEQSAGWIPTSDRLQQDVTPWFDRADLVVGPPLDPLERTAWVRERHAWIRCPSDPNPEGGVDHRRNATTNYLGCMGRGPTAYGSDGALVSVRFSAAPAPFDVRSQLRLADIVDGLSSTVAMSEALGEWGRPVNGGLGPHLPRLHWFWGLGEQFWPMDAFEAFCAACEALPARPGIAGFLVTGEKELQWLAGGNSSWFSYSHALPPNRPSCMAGSGASWAAIHTAASYHRGGVNMLFLDGRVAFISQDIDLDAYRAIASRAGDESVVLP
jgi:prepilin-type processing-associated H-X9-DG protein